MMGLDEAISAVVGVFGLVAGGVGWLARRDTRHKNKLEDEIESNSEDIDELDTEFARLGVRLFGYPADDSDRGALPSREQRIERAEDDIDSLSDEVQYAKEAAEENGEAIEHLDERVTEHARQTMEALARIEEQLDEQLIPRDDDLLQGGGEPGAGDD